MNFSNLDKIKSKIKECQNLEDAYFDCDTMRKNKHSVVSLKQNSYINYKFKFLTSNKLLYEHLSNYFASSHVDWNSIDSNFTPLITPPVPTFSTPSTPVFIPPPVPTFSISAFSTPVVPTFSISAFSTPSPSTPVFISPTVPTFNQHPSIPPPSFIPSYTSPSPSPNIVIPSVKPEKKYKKIPIPTEIRTKVWRSWCNDKMDGKCFCCDCDITWEKWECGHIRAEAHGGETSVNNLKPVCKPCNRGMSSQHMYLYMFIHTTKGLKNLNPKDPEVEKRREEANKIKLANLKIDSLVNKKDMKKTEATKLKNGINNKRETTVNRLNKIEDIKNK